MSDDDSKKADCVDRVDIIPGTPIALVHEADHTTSVGVAIRLKEGQPLPPGPGALVQGGRVVYRHDGGKRSGGPAQVASPGYRDGWDAIWGQKRGEA